MVVWTHLVTSLLPSARDANTKPRGNIIQINEAIVAGQGAADISVLVNGNIALVCPDWPNFTNFNDEAYCCIFTAAGVPPTGELWLGPTRFNDQRLGHVAPIASGGFKAVWNDGRVSNTPEILFAQEIGADGAHIDPKSDFRATTRPRMAICWRWAMEFSC